MESSSFLLFVKSEEGITKVALRKKKQSDTNEVKKKKETIYRFRQHRSGKQYRFRKHDSDCQVVRREKAQSKFCLKIQVNRCTRQQF